MMILADIAQGKTAGGDVCFLIALILFAIAAILSLVPGPAADPARTAWWPGLRLLFISAGLAFTAFGLLLQ
jgi:hypothetical protein